MTDHFCKLELKFCTTVRSLAQITLVFHAKFSFQNELKSLCPFRSTLYCPLDDQRPLKKQALLLLQITKKFITNYVSFAFITNCDSFFISLGHNQIWICNFLQCDWSRPQPKTLTAKGLSSTEMSKQRALRLGCSLKKSNSM